MNDDTDLEAQLKAMTTNDVAIAYIMAANELERRGIDPQDLEFVWPEAH